MGLPAPWLILLVLACVLLAAIPTRRLADAGLRPAWLAAYLLVLVAMGVAVVVSRGAGRVLVPFLVVLYVIPLVAGPEAIARWVRRGRHPPKQVGSGPGRDVQPDGSGGPGGPGGPDVHPDGPGGPDGPAGPGGPDGPSTA